MFKYDCIDSTLFRHPEQQKARLFPHDCLNGGCPLIFAALNHALGTHLKGQDNER
jgi:hypothetical protein